MSQHQKSADNMVLKELEKQKAREKQLDAESKRIAEAVRPQTSIDDLVHQAADEVAHRADSSTPDSSEKLQATPKAAKDEPITETLSEAKKTH